ILRQVPVNWHVFSHEPQQVRILKEPVERAANPVPEPRARGCKVFPCELSVVGQQSLQRRHIARADQRNSLLEELVDAHGASWAKFAGYLNTRLDKSSDSCKTQFSAHWGASCPRQGNHPTQLCSRAHRRTFFPPGLSGFQAPRRKAFHERPV